MYFPAKYTRKGDRYGCASSHGDLSFEIRGNCGGEIVVAECRARTEGEALQSFESREIEPTEIVLVRPANGRVDLPKGKVVIVRDC